MIDLQTLPADEAERLAYAEGYPGTAALFAKIADLEAQVTDLEDQLNEVSETENELRDCLYAALPYVEDLVDSEVYKGGAVKKMIARIFAALGETPR